MILIGLRNSGEKYKKTRHNVGAIVLEYLQNENLLNGSEVYFPDTFMNLSGEYVKKILKNKNLDKEKIFVFFDDVTLPVGKYKISVGEGASSHNGIKSIIENIQSLGLTKDDFVRVRIGVGKMIKEVDGDGKETGKEKLYEPGPEKLSDFVLSNLNNLEIAQIQGLAKEILEKINN
jgi:PTH1 family peptidyl-tRNA hydrolase